MNKVNPVKIEEEDPTHILLVDDDISLLDTVKKLLEIMGYIVISATGSREAIDLMNRYKLDLVITDYSMPDMNGVEMVIEAKKILLGVPKILYTGRIDLIGEKQITEAGIDEVITKPCRISKLDSIIKKVVAEKKKAKPKILKYMVA